MSTTQDALFDTGQTTAPVKKARTSRIKDVSFTTPDGNPLLSAASIALSVMRHMKVSTWAEVEQIALAEFDKSFEDKRKLLAALVLDEHQNLLLTQYAPFLRLLRLGPTVSIAICPGCFRVTDAPAPIESTAEPGGEPQVLAISPVQAHGWALIQGAVPSKCKVTTGCTEKPVKAGFATKAS